MRNPHTQTATTYSMIVASVIETLLQTNGRHHLELFEGTNITPATWARMTKGQSKLDIEQLFGIEKKFGYKVSDILRHADEVKERAIADGVNLVPPIPTQAGRLTKTDGVAIVALAFLAVLALQQIQKS